MPASTAGNATLSSVPAYLQSLINSAPGSIARRFPAFWSDNEGGIDFNAPQGTPVIALADGPIVGAGYFDNSIKNWCMSTDTGYDHGVVTQDVTNADGTHTFLYYQHIIINPAIKNCCNGTASCNGQSVKKGDTIGWISNFNMMEMGVNVGNSVGGPKGSAHWGGIWGADPNPGPHVDPENYIRSLVATGGFPPGIPGSSAGSSIGGLFDFASIAPTLKSWGEYAAIFIFALLFIAVGIYLLGGHPVGAISNAVQTPITSIQNRRASLKAGA